MDATLVLAKVGVVAKMFDDDLGAPLWGTPPVDPLVDIARAVTTSDELKSRIASLTASFEHFNKKDFDKIVGTPSEGTRKAFVAFLKFRVPDDQIRIDREVAEPLDLICLLRDYLIHARNRNYKKALVFFGLSDPISDFSRAWSSVLFAFSEVLDRLLEIVSARQQPRIAAGPLMDETLDLVVASIQREKRHVLETPKVASLLREIVSQGAILDADLAGIFGLEVEGLRRLLFPLSESVLIVLPVDRHSTRLEVVPEFRALVQSGELFKWDGHV